MDDYPHGHHHRPQHHHLRDEDEYPPPPPPSSFYNGPPPPSFFYNGPPPPSSFYNEPPPPPQVYHTSHTGPEPYHPRPGPPPPEFPNYAPHPGPHGPPPPVAEPPHHQRPHFPSHHDKKDEITNKPSVRMYSKAETNYSLAIREGKVILARADPSDPTQHWVKDERYSTKVKDEEGFPSFALVNKATGLAMKHSIGPEKPVQLVPYNPNVLDESILWTESKDLGDTYRAIRMVNNIKLNVDAFNGDKNHGGVHDGTTIVLWEWKKGDNQRWKIVPHCK